MAIKCKQLVYTPVNALTIRLSGGTTSLIPHIVDNKIISLEGPENINIFIGLTTEVKKFKYKINTIKQLSKDNI